MNAYTYNPPGYGWKGQAPSLGRLYGMGSMGDACGIAAALTPNFTNDDIAGAYNALVQTFQQEQANYTAMVAQLRQNAASLTPVGLSQAQAALMQESNAVNSLEDIVSQATAIVNCLGISGTNVVQGLSGLGLWPLLIAGAVVAVLTAMGLWALIQQANANADAAKAQFQAAQNMQSTITAANQCLQAGICSAADYNAMLAAGAQAQPCPQGTTRDDKGGCQGPGFTGLLANAPWKTVAVVGGGLLVAKMIFG